MDALPPDPAAMPEPGDPFGPPAEPCECWCMHCHRTFSSTGIWWQRHLLPGGKEDGMWLCPTPNCDGAGFTFDIFPTDPAHPANDGWHSSDGGDEDGGDEDGVGEPFGEDELDGDDPGGDESPYDPAEPKYAALDADAAEQGDIEGEEWKHGLQPGDAPPEPEWAEAARKERAAEEARYDAPDERPRVLDESHLPPPTGPADAGDEADVPF